MGNYDFEMDFSTETSVGKIFNKIKYNSTVLEFGCANGRMTKSMRERLECKVYIVEYDEEAFNEALQYAEDGICDDILRYAWCEKFADIKFDAIIFADVLEHLSDPEKVLREAGKMLAEDGEVLISIPNVTHNDIVVKMLNEHFDYTKTGLLDETHVHFWGLKNIPTLAEHSGLFLKKVEATYLNLGQTEQADWDLEPSVFLKNELLRRDCGNVYQFVITMGVSTLKETIYDMRHPSVESHIYLNKGGGYNGTDVIGFTSTMIDKDIFQAHYILKDIENVRAVRFDPVEEQACIVRNLSIIQDGKRIDNYIHNGALYDGKILFFDSDPMIIVDDVKLDKPIIVDAEIILVGEMYFRECEIFQQILLKDLGNERESLSITNAVLEEKQQVLVEKQKEIEQQKKIITKLYSDIEQMKKNMDQLQQEKRQLESELLTTNARLQSYRLLVNEQQKKIITKLYSDIEQMKKNMDQLQQEKRQLESELLTTNARLQSYRLLVNKKEEIILDLKQRGLFIDQPRIFAICNKIATTFQG